MDDTNHFLQITKFSFDRKSLSSRFYDLITVPKYRRQTFPQKTLAQKISRNIRVVHFYIPHRCEWFYREAFLILYQR